MKILFVDACVRKESRTRKLARSVLERMNGTVTEVYAASATKAITDESFILARTDASERKDFSDPVFAPARQFAEAEGLDIIGADAERILREAMEEGERAWQKTDR